MVCSLFVCMLLVILLFVGCCVLFWCLVLDVFDWCFLDKCWLLVVGCCSVCVDFFVCSLSVVECRLLTFVW